MRPRAKPWGVVSDGSATANSTINRGIAFMRTKSSRIQAAAILVAASSSLAGTCLAGERIADIVLARQGSDAQQVLKDWTPLAKLIEAETGKTTKIFVHKDVAAIREAIAANQVDMII